MVKCAPRQQVGFRKFGQRIQSRVQPASDEVRRWYQQDPVAPDCHSARNSRHLCFEPGLYPLFGVAFFPTHRSRPVHHQPESPSGTRLEIDGPICSPRRERYQRSVAPRDLQTSVIEHRRDPGILIDLHQQLRPAHGHRANQSEAEHKVGSYST